MAYEDGEAVFIDTEYDTWNIRAIRYLRSRKQDSPIELIKRKIDIVDYLHYDGAKEFEVRSDVTLEETEDEVKRVVWNNI